MLHCLYIEQFQLNYDQETSFMKNIYASFFIIISLCNAFSLTKIERDSCVLDLKENGDIIKNMKVICNINDFLKNKVPYTQGRISLWNSSCESGILMLEIPGLNEFDIYSINIFNGKVFKSPVRIQSWSAFVLPDGKDLYFQTSEENGKQIFHMNATDFEIRKIVLGWPIIAFTNHENPPVYYLANKHFYVIGRELKNDNFYTVCLINQENDSIEKKINLKKFKNIESISIYVNEIVGSFILVGESFKNGDSLQSQIQIINMENEKIMAKKRYNYLVDAKFAQKGEKVVLQRKKYEKVITKINGHESVDKRARFGDVYISDNKLEQMLDTIHIYNNKVVYMNDEEIFIDKTEEKNQVEIYDVVNMKFKGTRKIKCQNCN